MISLEGVFDLHLHALPDLTVRNGDELTFARQCKEVGMVGFAVKNVLESTVNRARYVNMMVPGFNYVGGICLNYTVGGVNPTAAEACLQQGGRIVWMPSGHAKFHKDHFGFAKYGLKRPIYLPPDAQGITVLDENGELTEETKAVVEVAKYYNALVATSHLAPEESLKLGKFCSQQKVKHIYTHLMWAPEYSLEVGKQFIEDGGMVELTAVTFGGFVHKRKLAECVEAINTLGAKNLVLSSDTGAVRSMIPSEIFRMFSVNLSNAGVSDDDLNTMMKKNPLAMIAE